MTNGKHIENVLDIDIISSENKLINNQLYKLFYSDKQKLSENTMNTIFQAIFLTKILTSYRINITFEMLLIKHIDFNKIIIIFE